MKRLLLIAFFQFLVVMAWADHLVGGELFYVYKGISANNGSVYKVTLRFFRNMASNVPSIENEPVYIGIYQNNNLLKTITLPFEKVDTIRSKTFPACINNSLQTIYEVGYFSEDVELPQINGDYTLAWIRCCRTNAVANMNLNNGGITLTTVIPGTNLVGLRPNNSAVFQLRDTILLCNGQYFNLESAAIDADNDSLTYRFEPALNGASDYDPTPRPNNTIAYAPLSYKGPQFSAAEPMGADVKLDAATGRIKGTAPVAGTYLVTVRVFEWRNNQIINEHSKDILIKVRNCSYSVAQLKPEYIYCDSSVLFANELQGSSTDSWFWDFGVDGTASDTSNLPTPRYNYQNPGTYNVTLVINKDKPCPATASTKVTVYPELKSGFTFKDSCVQTGVQFTDTSHHAIGTINKWFWDFGEPVSPNNTSQLQNPIHSFNTSGLKTIRLITGTDKGCTDTAYGSLNVLPRPDLKLLQHSISLCKGDSVQLRCEVGGPVLWTPNRDISNVQSVKPLVFPSFTTTYLVTVDDSKCNNKDSVTIIILPRDAVQVRSVLPICKGDTLNLAAITNASIFQWIPVSYMQNNNSLTPAIFPSQNIMYRVIANPGPCQTEDSIVVTVLDRPIVSAGGDMFIKEGETVQLKALGADFYRWLPEEGLSNIATPNPFVSLPFGVDSMTYIVNGMFRNGCSNNDTVIVHVNVNTLIDAPAAFTPNGDGKNEIFRPIVKGAYQLVDFSVFNRWGQLVFRTKEAAKGWNGKTHGSDTTIMDAYVWMVQARNKNTGELVYKKGTVTLIK